MGIKCQCDKCRKEKCGEHGRKNCEYCDVEIEFMTEEEFKRVLREVIEEYLPALKYLANK